MQRAAPIIMQIARRWFCVSSGTIFAITGMAKIWSSYGNAEILKRLDPILDMPFGHLMLAVGTLELAVAALCLLSKSKVIATIVVAWLASGFLTYRMGLWWIGWRRPCSCLGNLTDALHIPPQSADTAMIIILGYLLIGSYATLFWLWRQRKKAAAVSTQN